jgi:6,7-dimethyl-8-ribityllumazine synthase
MPHDPEAPPHVLIIEARFYTHIADFLVQGAVAEIERRKARYSRITVPGAFEIPAAIRMALLARHRRLPDFDGYVALGCVIRGETSHYDYVCGESARGLMELSHGLGLAIGYGILTVENEAQALARAKPDQKNKGRDAAAACLDMIALRSKLANLE